MAHPMKKAHEASLSRRLRMIGGKGKSSGMAKYSRGGSIARMAETNAPAAAQAGLSPMGAPSKPRGDRMARGGKTKGKGNHVNIVIATNPKSADDNQQPPQAVPVPIPVGGPGGPGGAPPMPPHPMPAGLPPGMPPGGPMKRGGKVMHAFKRGGSVKHADEAEDKKLISKMIGKAEKKEEKKEARKMVKRKSGGSVPHMKAGAESGEGRLEKAAMARRK